MGAITAFLVAACTADAGPVAAPALVSAVVVPSPENALSLRIAVTARSADSARVLWRAAGTAADSSPFVQLSGSGDTLLVLGLAPATAYRLVVQLAGKGGLTQSDSMDASSVGLPSDLANVALASTGTASATGFLLTAVAVGPRTYMVAFDYAGAVRWYHEFDEATNGGAEVKLQRNGHFTTYLGLSQGFQATYGHYVEVAPDGRVLRTISAPAPYYTDDHEFLITGSAADERFHFFGYDLRALDLTSQGGGASVLTAGHSLLRLTPSGQAEFFWSAWDHFTLADWIEPIGLTPATANIDIDHPNALDIATNGDYIVSWRNMGEVTRLSAQTGAIVWRLGGSHSGFTFVNDPLNGFSGQHSVRVLSNGNVLLFDNGLRHNPTESRAAEYKLDIASGTAILVWQYRHAPALFSGTRGCAFRLANGHTIVGFGVNGIIDEVDASGTSAWEASMRVGGVVTAFYRVTPIASLYGYAIP